MAFLKGFTIILIPRDASGVERNKDFHEKAQSKPAFALPLGGKTSIDEKGVLKCEWKFRGFMPDSVQNIMLARFTKQLDQSIKKRDNVSYEVEFL